MKYDIYWKYECVGYFEVDIAQGELLKNYSETDDIVINPFALKKSFREIERVLEGRRYSKDRRVKIDELRFGHYDDVWNEINITLSSNYDDLVKVVREDLNPNPTLIGNKGNQEKFMLEDGLWIKYDYMDGDAMAEVISSKVLDVLGFEYIPYDFYQNEITTCISPNLLKEGESLITLHRYFVSRYDHQKLEKFYHSIFDKGSFKKRYQRLVEALHSH